jgi:membrane complex biogenesis BtpA family protein
MALFTRAGPCSLIGVVHLLPLPGSPLGSDGLDSVVRRAIADARTLARCGADALIVENLGDAPFAAERVGPATVAQMTRCALAVREAAPALTLGINVLRNDALAALAIAVTCDAAFIRVNVHTGTMVTDQGVITGRARETLLERNRLGATTHIAADVLVKHAAPLAERSLAQVACDTAQRGGASALIVTGSGTGRPVDPERVRAVRDAVPTTPLWIGSGLDPDNARQLVPMADAAIVGTYLHTHSDLRAPLDPQRVEAMARWVRGESP